MHILGIDIGGSGVKGAVVNVNTGELISERHRIATPQPATPEAVASTLSDLVQHFNWQGPVGCGFPAAIQQGIARTAANVSPLFIGTHVNKLFTQSTGCECFTLNDADAAGLTEMRFGEGKQQSGVVLLITIGTGLGTVFFSNGQLLPNTELGHILLQNGKKGEHYASDAARKADDLSWKAWANRFNQYLLMMEALFWPDLIILGGGASKKFEKYNEYLTLEAAVKPASFLNQAGIVGAALFAHEQELLKTSY